MEPKTVMRALSLLMVMMFAGMIFVPAVSAEKDQLIIDDKERLQIINELWRTDISVGEYYEKAFPELLEGIDEKTKNEFYNLKISWPEKPKQINPTEKQSEKSNLEKKIAEINDRAGIKSAVLTYGDSTIEADGRSITHKSETWVAFPPYLRIPNMGITSYLFKQVGSGEEIINTAFDSKNSVDNLKVEDTKLVSEPGYYYTGGLHVNKFPAGYEPPSESKVTSTDAIWVN